MKPGENRISPRDIVEARCLTGARSIPARKHSPARSRIVRAPRSCGHGCPALHRGALLESIFELRNLKRESLLGFDVALVRGIKLQDSLPLRDGRLVAR